MWLLISLFFFVGVIGTAPDSFWHETKNADSVSLLLCYAFSLFGTCIMIVRKYPSVRDSLLGTFAAFCFAMSLR